MGSLTQQQCKDLVLTYASCTLYLVVLYAISKFRAISMEKRPTEDGTILAPAKALLDNQTPEDKLRRERVLGNNIENIPLALIVFWGAFTLQLSLIYQDLDTNEATVKALTALIILFSFSRTLHNVCYSYGIQPVRSIVFLIGELCFLATCCMLVFLATKFEFNFLPSS